MSAWEEYLNDYNSPEVRDLFRVFPIPKGMRYNPVKSQEIDGVDLHDWAKTATGIEKEMEFTLRYRGGNFGCSTTNLLVVDLDIRDEIDGVATWKKLTKTHGSVKTWTSKTPRGGFHMFFRITDDQKAVFGGRLKKKDSFGGPGSGVDIKVGQAQVILPGSRTEFGEYRWTSRSPWEVDLADCPEWILPKLCASQRKPVSRNTGPRKKTTPDDHPVLAEGGRDNGIAKAIGTWYAELRLDVANGKMTELEAGAIVLKKAKEYNRGRTKGVPLADSRVESIFKSITRSEIRNHQAAMAVPEVRKAVESVMSVFKGARIEEIAAIG